MKKIVLVGAIVASVFSASAQQTAGKIFSGPDAGKGFQLGSEKNSQILLDFVKAYNAKDGEKELSFYTPEMAKKREEMTKKSIAYIKTVEDVPMAILPVKVAGSNEEIVMLQSVETRVANNGSKETLNLFELFKFNKEGKITSFTQYGSIPKTNEYGQTSGGKYFTKNPKNEWNGRAFQFSNRGEVEVIEKFAKAYNAFDIPAVMEVFADTIKITDFEGNKMTLLKKDIPAIFTDYKSMDWKIDAILPFKIAYTDPASAIMVISTEKRVMKDGSVWDKSLVEYFYFNNEGKISGFDQYYRPNK
jgi:ketosteroid isomerase-like protein